jgi:heterodisulfide reductase subunit D
MKVGGAAMNELKKTNLRDFKENWTLCGMCGGCYYRGPIVPHNWLELPPPEWSSPLHRCPSFEYFKFRAYTALGRGNLAEVIFGDEQFPVTDDLLKIVYTCTSCGMCSEVCQVFQPLMATWALREELVRRGAARPEPVEKMDTNIAKYNNIFGARRLPKAEKEIPNRGEYIYFAGCTVRFTQPKMAGTIVEILHAAGLDIACLGEEEKCCGFVAGHDGNTWLFEQQARQNVEALKKSGAKYVVVSCAHCYKALKIDYPLVVGELPFEVLHIAELLAKLIDEGKVKFASEVRRTLTYHDPCFLGRHCKVYDEPRKVLESIPGIKLVEMERNRRWSYCCGSGAKIVENCYPEFSTATTKDRLLEAKQAADTMATACASCFSVMNKAAKEHEIELEIYDLPTLVAEAMGIKS